MEQMDFDENNSSNMLDDETANFVKNRQIR